MSGPQVQLVALDIDGTLIDFDEYLTDRVRDAVQALHASETHLVVATGRSLHATLPVLERLQVFTGWCVCSNGSLVLRLDPEHPEGYVIERAITFDPAQVLKVVHEQLPAALYAVETVGRGFRLTAPFPEGELTGDLEYVSFVDLLDTPATRVIVRSPEHTSEDFVKVTETLGLHEITYAVGWSAWLDLAPFGVNKASALEFVREQLQVPATATLAVGDGRNDLEMFDWAHRSVAMGQAPEDVRARAGEVTATVQEDGAALVIEALLKGAVTAE